MAAVNRPTDVKQKEADVNQKLQLYGIYSAFANGKAPSNKQIDIALNSALESKPLSSPSKKLSTEGQKLVGDLKDVIEKAKQLLLTKNEGNLLQDFIWQTQQLGSVNVNTPGAPIDKNTAQQHGNEALEGLRTLGTLIISNGQFRKLLSDASILLRDIAGDAAQKTANKVNPTDEQLSQVDKPAEDNVWHENPDLSAGNLKAQAKGIYEKNKPFGKNDVNKAAGDATQSAHPGDSRDPADAANLAAHEQQTGQQTGLDAAGGAQAGASTLRQAASENVPEETKQKGNEYADRTKDYLSDKLPKERRDQTIFRLKKMVVEIQGHQDYQRAIETLLRLAEEYTGHGKTLAQQGQGTVKGAHDNTALTTAETDLKTLIERFANSTSLDDLIESINQIYRDADQDPELKGWFTDVDRYIRKCLQQQGYILEEESSNEWDRLYDRGQYLLRDKYRVHTDHLLDEIKFYGNQFDADPQNKAFGQALQTLFLDLGNDENGKATFKPHLVKDLTEVILPGIFESVRYVPIPRIEVSTPEVDAIIENLVIESDNLAPNALEFSSDNYWRWGRKQIQSKNKNRVELKVSGVQMDLRDVSYYVKRKTGSPKLTDKGVVDLFLGGQGLSFTVDMETIDKANVTDKAKVNSHFFKVNKVDVNVKNLKVKIKKSNHKLLFSLFSGLGLKLLRPAIEKAVEKQIKDQINELDSILYGIHQEAKKSQESAKRDPSAENIQNIYQAWYNAAQKKILEGKQKKEQIQEKTKDTKVNAAVTQHDSIFKDIKLPGGISTKATEYKDLAASGDKWESPVFSIGSSKESTSLPKLTPVTRKRQGGPPTVHGAGSTSGYNTQHGASLTGLGGAGTGAGLTSGPGVVSNGTAAFGQQVDSAFGASKPVTQVVNGSANPGAGAVGGV